VGPRRQQTLEATIDWSYRLLTGPEQCVFERLAIFAGGLSLDAAEAICVDEDIAPDMVLPIMAGLVDKSLVVAEKAIEPGPRFRLLETVRHFARARLQEHQDRAVFERHANFFLALAERTFERARASQPWLWYEHLVADHNNLRLALEYFEAHDPERMLRLASGLWQFWSRTGMYHEGALWLERALSSGASGTPRVRGTAICGLVELRWPAGHFEQMQELSQVSLELARHTDDAWLTAFSLYHLAIPALRAGDIPRSVALTEQSVALARTTQDSWLTTYMLNALGVCLLRSGELSRARDLFEEALKLARAAGDELLGAYQLACLGEVARAQNDLDRAEALWSETLTIAAPRGDWRLVGHQLLTLAEVAFRRKQLARAARLLGAGEALYERLRVTHEFPLPELDPLRDAARDGPLAHARRQGRTTPTQKVVSEIVAAVGISSPALGSRRDGPLTAREREVAGLVVEGLSNREIASRLVITERTAENHVSHILNKLAVDSRAQLVRELSSP
jgi:non-specific serine/threonine protein kinase